MISYKQALYIIGEQFKDLQRSAEKISLTDSTGRILAEEIYADSNLPPFNNSAMDGYAVKYDEEVNEWNISGSISAGNYKLIDIPDETAVEIMTGAKLPPGFDTVIPIEDVAVSGNRVMLNKSALYRKEMNLRKAGEDILSGSLLLPSNKRIKPQDIAALASAGKAEVSVYKKLNIGIFSTGDELVDITELPTGDKIRASNLYALLAAVKEINMEPLNHGIINDNQAAIKETLSSLLDMEIDILITTGGVSAGKYDYVTDILREMRAEIHFHKLNIKPGKPVLFASLNKMGKRKFIFGLPGNPVSALVTFIILIKKSILAFYKLKEEIELTAVLAKSIRKEDAKMHFVRGRIEKHNGEYFADPFSSQSSGNIAEMAAADCLIVIEEDKINPCKGEKVNCILI